MKNIKIFNGQPLIYWNLKELQATALVDKIVVSTDSEEIAKTVEAFGFSKVEIHNRSPENAQDKSSTESVMLEYLSKANLNSDDFLMLVQATSPLTKAKHFSEGISKLISEKADSLLTVVPSKRFFWTHDGQPINYDYNNRPRRQDFEGRYMENGAFYISSVAAIMKSKNRLSGKITLYTMPEHTAYEIDEPSDWIILEQLHKNLIADN